MIRIHWVEKHAPVASRFKTWNMSSEKPEIIFILNPHSGGGASLEGWTQIKRILKDLAFDYRLVKCEGNLSECLHVILREGVKENTRIAGIGGDGTHCAIINGIFEFSKNHPANFIPSYSIIPLGTGNNLAKSFNIIPQGSSLSDILRKAILGAAYGAKLKVDIGKLVDGLYFVDAFSAGFDAHILAGRNQDIKKLKPNSIFRGYPVYLFNIIKSLIKYRPVKATATVDGKTVYSGPVFNVLVNNTRIYAGEFDLTDKAVANDGMLDLLIIKGRMDHVRTYLSGIRSFSRWLRGKLSPRDLSERYFKGKKFEFNFSTDVTAQVDGELIQSAKSFSIETVPRAVTLRVPVEPD